MSTRKTRSFGLVALGVVAGILASVGISAVAQRSGTPLPLDELRQFTSVFGAIKNNYVESVEDEKLISGAISGMLSSLDPHSAYLDAEAFEDMQNATQGEFGGLGIEVGAEDGFVKVISPIEDTPAARAGVLAGDLIVKIDDTPTKGLSLNDAVKLMRGAPKTMIKLTIVREGLDQPVTINIERDIIKVRSVRSKMLDDGYGYVRVSQFQERTGADLVKHLRDLGSKGAPKGLILDLRNDPGGLLNGAIGVSAAFLPPDVLVVSTDGRVPESRHRYLANPVDFARGETNYLRDLPDWAKTVPMVVLVNAGSASASEIVAGALQDHGRAKIMGNRTFGKGSVQVILPLSDSTGIKLTTSRYYTPNGNSIQAKGIEPDIVVADTEKGDLFRLPREADLQRHLSNQQTPDSEVRSEEMDAEALKDFKMFEFGGSDDFQLRQAINHLEGKPVDSGGVRSEVVRIEPAAEPAGKKKMNDAQLLRHARHILLDEVGIEGLQRWLDASVLIIGAGGLGSPVALYLAAAGVGHIVLADDDRVELSNLQRQILHDTAGVGEFKAESGRQAMAALNPEVRVDAVCRRLDAAALDELVGKADLVLDCSDNFATRHAINRACVQHRTPLVMGAAIRFDGQVSVFDFRQPGSPCYHCLFPESDEPETMTCATSGVFGPVVGIIGSVQATEALKVLAGVGQSLCGRLLWLDALSMQWRSVKVIPDPECPVCGGSHTHTGHQDDTPATAGSQG